MLSIYLTFLEYGESQGTPYIVSEYVPGGTLRERINAACPITLDEALKILVQVGRAIHMVHLHNIVHSDLKPENILFNEKGDAILSDFGIAIRLGSNEIFFGLPRGTYAYMAPEQFDGLFTKESDQYALGCIGYELLTGKHPFEPFLPYAPQDHEIMKERHKNTQVRSPSELNIEVPNSVGQALLRAMAKKSSDRYTSIASFIHALRSSTASSSRLSHRVAAALQTPPPFSSVMEEASYPPSRPPDKHDVASLNLEACYEMLQPEGYASRPLRSYHYRQLPLQFSHDLPIQFMQKNAGEDDKRTDPALPVKPKPVHRQVGKKPSQTLPPEKSGNPREALKDLRLCQNFPLRQELVSILRKFQLGLCDKGITSDPFTGIQRKYTQLQIGTNQRFVSGYYLLYIPGRFLTAENIPTIRDLGPAFPRGSTLIIFSDLDKPLSTKIDLILTGQWKTEGREVIFITQGNVNEMQAENKEFQRSWLIQKLHLSEVLSETLKKGPILSVQQMKGNDTDTLVRIIAAIPQLIDNQGQGWRVMLSQAGLGDIASELHLSGTARDIAWQLIDRLKTRARLPDPKRSECEVLGLLLCSILERYGNIPLSDQSAVQKIIVKYRLVPPERYPR